uniref:E2-binding protein 3 n=1 Tax=Homo sapiens TaxID=9606 RepID=Q2PYN5_HUMAN|nr:E2-binding protein 3 [Homo sapiens]
MAWGTGTLLSRRWVSGGVRGSGSIWAAAGHDGAAGESRPRVPPLWAPGAGSQPGCGRALCPQGGSPVLLHTLGVGLAGYPAHGGLFSAPGLLPVSCVPLEASFNVINSHSSPCLPAPFGADPSGLCVDCFCLCGIQCYPPGTVCPHQGTMDLAASPR